MQLLKMTLLGWLFVLSAPALIKGETPEVLTTLFNEFQEWRISQYPLYATVMGNHKYNDKIMSFNLTRFESYKVKADSFHKRLMNISSADLEPSDLQNFKVLQYMLDTYIEGYQWRYYLGLNPQNFLDFVHLGGYTNVPMYTRGDVENYLQRIALIPQQIDEIIECFREAIKVGITYHRVSVEPMIPELLRIANISEPKNSTLFTPLDKSVVVNEMGYTEIERQAILTKAISAISDTHARIEVLANVLTSEYLPATRTDFGVASFPRGREYYQALVKYYLTTDMSPDEVHEIGKTEVARLSGLMKEIMEKQGYFGTPFEYFEAMKNDSRHFYDTGEELLNGYREQIMEIKQRLPKYFKNLPGLPLQVVASESNGIMGVYYSGTPDGSKPGRFIANTFIVDETPKFGMMALTLHETYPGHHFQTGYLFKSSLPKFRSNIISDYQWMAPFSFSYMTAYAEGWALYGEALGEEMKLYKDDYELIGRYSSEIFRACRLVVDTGIHYKGWSRQQSIDYFKQNVIAGDTEVQTEIDRYSTWPGQALAYKIGELKIKELRKRAEDKLGVNFDIQEFHLILLENGELPLSLLEEMVDHWISNYKPEEDEKPCTSGGADTTVLTLLAIVLLTMVTKLFK